MILRGHGDHGEDTGDTGCKTFYVNEPFRVRNTTGENLGPDSPKMFFPRVPRVSPVSPVFS